jgi:hypothetical protein
MRKYSTSTTSSSERPLLLIGEQDGWGEEEEEEGEEEEEEEGEEEEEEGEGESQACRIQQGAFKHSVFFIKMQQAHKQSTHQHSRPAVACSASSFRTERRTRAYSTLIPPREEI